MTFAEALGVVAPWYNLTFVLVVLLLFRNLFKVHYDIHHEQTFTKPWKLLRIAVYIFIVEEVFTVLRHADVFKLPVFFNGIFEIAMVSIFIYTLMIQYNHIKEVYQK